MIFSLAACGGKSPAASADADQPETIKLGKHTAVFKGYALTKDEDGMDAMILTYDYTNGSSDEQSFAWAFLYEATQAGEELGSPWFDENGDSMAANYEEMVEPGKTLEVRFPLGLVNTTDDVTIRFSDFDDHEYTQTIRLSESGEIKVGGTGSGGGLRPVGGGQAGEPQTDSDDYWHGDWYGWWHVTSAGGYWEELEDSWYDCCARITKRDDSNGYIVIWDEDGSGNNEYMVECAVSFGPGITDAGCMMSQSGTFWQDDPIEHADWIIDPGASVVSQYDHMICINGTYEDPENDGDFDYKIYLRPWGMDWEDVAVSDPDMLPYTYESWYLPAIEAGIAMPDYIGGGDFLAPGEVPDDLMEPQGGDPEESADQVEEEATVPETIPDSGTLGEYGFSVADATGIVPLATLKSAYRYIRAHTSDLTYGALYAQMGNVHGAAQTSGSVWQSGKYEYRWGAESGEYLYVIFSVDANGNERYKGGSSSLGLGD